MVLTRSVEKYPRHSSVAGQNDQQGTGINPSPNGPTPIYSPSAVAAPDQGTPGLVDKTQDRIPLPGIQAVAGPSNPNPGTVNNPQDPNSFAWNSSCRWSK
ncbi:hypothetical protein Patl1_24350 [Pistacia atlantica]|uniref:Uncharacterized protein n=1 Tax=Pistacia atlantica TaxID=434234 RepID=A0ACC0ZV77_9ROSI|nr:hypothetical protein Patl1_24350 [Pistacia atlantica]